MLGQWRGERSGPEGPARAGDARHSPNHLLIYSRTYLLICGIFTLVFVHSPYLAAISLTHSLTHSLSHTDLLTHRLTRTPTTPPLPCMLSYSPRPSLTQAWVTSLLSLRECDLQRCLTSLLMVGSVKKNYSPAEVSEWRW